MAWRQKWSNWHQRSFLSDYDYDDDDDDDDDDDGDDDDDEDDDNEESVEVEADNSVEEEVKQLSDYDYLEVIMEL